MVTHPAAMATHRHHHPLPWAVHGIAEPPQSKKARTDQDAVSPLANLPDELVTEVLVRLPARSLARFRCVCRSWHAEITTARFLDRHRALAATRHKLAFLPVCLDHLVLAARHRRKHNDPSGSHFQCGGCPKIVGTRACHGLVLVERRCGSDRALLSVCNPSSGGRLELPPISGEVHGVRVTGIGFHTPAGEYKVVVVPHEGTSTSHRLLTLRGLLLGETVPYCHYGVITLGSADRGWRYRHVRDKDLALKGGCIDGHDPVFANGYLHWMYEQKSRSNNNGDHHVVTHGILCFSLADESFRQIPQPAFSSMADDELSCEGKCSVIANWKDVREKSSGPVQLAELGGSLCLVRDVRTNSEARGQLQIWRLEDYDAGSWSLNYLVDLPGPMRTNLMWPTCVVPLAYLPAAGGNGGSSSSREKRDLLLVTTQHEVLVYNPFTNTVRNVSSVPAAYHEGGSESLPERADSLRFVLYQDSFALLDDMRHGGGGHKFVKLCVVKW